MRISPIRARAASSSARGGMPCAEASVSPKAAPHAHNLMATAYAKPLVMRSCQQVRVSAYGQGLPRNVLSPGARHEDHQVRELLRSHVILERSERERELFHFLERDGTRLGLRGENAFLALARNDARQQRVHANALAAKLDRQRFREPDDAPLR